jgi:hypothetical protein
MTRVDATSIIIRHAPDGRDIILDSTSLRMSVVGSDGSSGHRLTHHDPSNCITPAVPGDPQPQH